MNSRTIQSGCKAIAIALVLTFASLTTLYAQTDTVYSNNQKIACSVKEITPDAVKFTYPNEDLINTVYKNTVQKIVFKSGRVQTFAEATSYKPVSGVMDYENVTVTAVESEVHGLYKLSDVGSKAKGTTVYANQERVKERAYKKIKIQAAMFGANVIYLTNQRSEGNKYGGYFQSGSPTETNLTGVAYSNNIPDFDAFKKLVGDKTNFQIIKKFELGGSDSDVSQRDQSGFFVVHNIVNNNGVVTIEGSLPGETNVTSFQLANFTGDSFSIAYRYKGTAYNYVIKV